MEKCFVCGKETEIEKGITCVHCLALIDIIADVNKTPEQRLIDIYAYNELKLRGEVQ